MSTQNIENFIPPIQSDGLNSAVAVNFIKTLNYVGNIVDINTGATLTVAQSGSYVLWDSATGFTITLPTPAVGLIYELIVAKTATIGTHSLVANNTTSQFMYGPASVTNITTGTVGTFVGTASIGQAIRMNGTTSGGSVGTIITVVATSATQWSVSGQLIGSGIVTTPWTTT